VVQRIYREAGEGRTLCQIAERLTSEGVPKPTGRGRPRWAHQTIRWILKTPHYAGEVHWWRRNRSANKAAGQPVDEWRPLDEQFAMPAECIPALVDKETFEIVQERLRLNRERSARSNRDPEATLLRGGFVRCGYCGDSMAALHARPKRRQAAFYRCARGMKYPRDCTQHGISATVLDPAIWAKIEQILLRPEIIAGELARMENQSPATDAEELERVDRALATIERQQRNLVDQLAEQGQVVAALITQKLASLDDQRKSLEDSRVTLLTRKANQEAAQSRLHELEAWCAKVAERLGSFSYQEKRAALDALGVTVKVWRTDHTPRWEAEASIPLAEASDQLLPTRQGLISNSEHFAARTYRAAGRSSTSDLAEYRCACRRGRAAR
jgi:site-specific DNA recombinase